MFRFNKELEYALMSLVTLGESHDLVTARELSERHSIPYKLLGRILQCLAREDIVTSVKGAHGGYRLERDPADVSLGEVVAALEGTNPLAKCLDPAHNCAQEENCNIKPVLDVFQDRFVGFLENTTLADFISQKAAAGGSQPAAISGT